MMKYGPYRQFTQPNKTIVVFWDVINVWEQVQQQYDYEEVMELWTHTCLCDDPLTLSETSCVYRCDESLLLRRSIPL